MKYVIYLDYNAGTHNPGWEYIKTEAKDVCEAIEMADDIWRNHNDLYLIRIMEKRGNNYRLPDGVTGTDYYAIMCKRSWSGWHRNNEQNCENEHAVAWCRMKGSEWFDCL